MKWPSELLLVRHAESAYNTLKKKKENDPEYREFKALFERNPADPALRPMAEAINKRFSLNCSDRETPITPAGEAQARITGHRMRQTNAAVPDIVFVSPYLRTMETLRLLQEEWPELASANIFHEERIREKDHGLALLYNDWRIYQVMQPEQRLLFDLLGDYDYRFLNGENIPDVRQRTRSWFSTLTREFAGHRVMAITHHLTILATRANLERMGPEEFLRLDREEKPVNCGVTRYVGSPKEGRQGRLLLKEYNKRHYSDEEVTAMLEHLVQPAQ
jgi:broad specificity phosphatase PhoE